MIENVATYVVDAEKVFRSQHTDIRPICVWHRCQRLYLFVQFVRNSYR